MIFIAHLDDRLFSLTLSFFLGEGKFFTTHGFARRQASKQAGVLSTISSHTQNLTLRPEIDNNQYQNQILI